MKSLPIVIVAALTAAVFAWPGGASEGEKPHIYDYVKMGVVTPPAPKIQTQAEADAKSAGCITCHSKSDEWTMHAPKAVVLGCTDCHGGNVAAGLKAAGVDKADPQYAAIRDASHVLPRFPEAWHFPSSANPKRSYTLLNKEAPEFVRFVNPSDYRIVRESCGACHLETIEAAERSLMATGAMLLGGASYNNGILPYKNYVLGENYSREGSPTWLAAKPAKGAGHGEGHGDAHGKAAGSHGEGGHGEGGHEKGGHGGGEHASSVGAIAFAAGTEGRSFGVLSDGERARGALPFLVPLPAWQVLQPADIFRVFERGGRNINPIFPEIGLPDSLGAIQRLEEPGRPDIRQSNRGPGTGLRIAVPVINIHKTRLNDPFTWFMGTNDQPGDYRTSGCGSCHVVYANDRDPAHSTTYAKYGRDGTTVTADPTIPRGESGHPLRHEFTRAIPSAQCMNCHMHQPNMFINSYYGYTMWDYESDAPRMWPGPNNTLTKAEVEATLGKAVSDADFERIYKRERFPTAAEVRETNERNPEAAAPRGLWADMDFLRTVADRNPGNRDTQFADYHGHGWNFRAIYKRDREGNLLDAKGDMSTWGTDTAHIVANDDPEKWRTAANKDKLFPEPAAVPGPGQGGKAVHMLSIHAEVGMQCADCHFTQDGHDNGQIHGEVANAVEIGCKDCHGTADAYPTLKTSNLAARPGGWDLTVIRNPDGKPRFEWVVRDGRRVLIQRSSSDPKLEWRMHLTKDSVTRGHPDFNEKSARAKLIGKVASAGGGYSFGPGIAMQDRAHGDDNMACYTCHLSWTTSCGGCHLPIEANWKSNTHKYEDQETRNFATYNPQVARDDMFQLGKHQTSKGNIVAPVRSSSALMLSSTNINRERIYVQQPPISAAGFSSQAFAPHFPHTVRTEETKTCTDCHLSKANDNNSIMAQLLLTGTNFVNFVGAQVWLGLEGGIEAVRVTEYTEPQAVFGSYLHKYAYPEYWKAHVEKNGRELIDWVRGKIFDKKVSGETDPIEDIHNTHQGAGGAARCIQARGEYVFVAEGRGGFRAYDMASIANKGVSEKIVRAPFSPLGHDTHIGSKNATCMAIASTQPIAVLRNDKMIAQQKARAEGKLPEGSLDGLNQEQAFHPIYRYAFITDAVEGLIITDIDTLNDGEPRNNFFRRMKFEGGASAWNPGGVLTGARHIVLGGHFAYVTTPKALVVVDLDNPSKPQVTATVPMDDPRASALQFRYLWVTTAKGLEVLNITRQGTPVAVPGAVVPMADARKLYIARTYAYVAAKQEGLVIVNVRNPEAPVVYQRYTADGKLNDAEDVILGATNASLFAYVADGRNGMKVIQMMSPESQPNFYGFSPPPKPELIAFARTKQPALAVSKGLDRDRAVDESGHQIAIVGRLGSRPFTRAEMEKLFIGANGEPYFVENQVNMADWSPRR